MQTTVLAADLGTAALRDDRGSGDRRSSLQDTVQTSVTFQASGASAQMVFERAVERVLAAVTDAAPESGERPGAAEIKLPGGACVTVTVAAPARPRTHRSGTWHLTGTVSDRTGTPPALVDAAVAALRRVPLTEVELAELRGHMPLTAGLPARLPPGALGDVAPLLVIHHMLDFVVMVEAIERLGAPPAVLTVLDKGYAYTHTERVDAHLRALGVQVWPWQQVTEALAAHAELAAAAGRRALLADDGGYTLPSLLEHLPHLSSTFVGLVEQTKSGIFRLEPYAGRIPLPIFSVAESSLKATVESYGIADAAVRNVLALLPDEKWEGQPALVVGYGRIGEQVAEVLRTRRMRVAVYDPDPLALVAAHERGLLTSRSLCGLFTNHRPLLVVGTSGRTSLRGEHLAHLARADTYLVSVTSRQRELALDEIAEAAHAREDLGRLGVRYQLMGGRAVTVLADGYPINFHHAESLPNRYSDLILAAMVVGMATVARPDNDFKAGHNVERTNQVLASSGLAERYYQLYGADR